jgi:hypothetical protein
VAATYQDPVRGHPLRTPGYVRSTLYHPFSTTAVLPAMLIQVRWVRVCREGLGRAGPDGVREDGCLRSADHPGAPRRSPALLRSRAFTHKVAALVFPLLPFLLRSVCVCVHCLLMVPRTQGACDSDCRAVRGARVGHRLGLRSGEAMTTNSTFLALCK